MLLLQDNKSSLGSQLSQPQILQLSIFLLFIEYILMRLAN
jgi:hypothetical protein